MAVLDGNYFRLCLASETPRLTIGLEWTRDGRSCLHFHALGPAPLRPSVSCQSTCHPNGRSFSRLRSLLFSLRRRGVCESLYGLGQRRRPTLALTICDRLTARCNSGHSTATRPRTMCPHGQTSLARTVTSARCPSVRRAAHIRLDGSRIGQDARSADQDIYCHDSYQIT